MAGYEAMSAGHSGLRFKDKVAIVTGGCKGIGRGCVDILAENGGKVVVLDIDDVTGAALRTTGPGEITFVHCDLTQEDKIKIIANSFLKKVEQNHCGKTQAPELHILLLNIYYLIGLIIHPAAF